MTLPSGDYIEGTFNGLWGDWVKINGTFTKGDQEEERNLYIRYVHVQTAIWLWS